MTIRFSSRNMTSNGHHERKDHMIWMHRSDSTSRLLGVAIFTTYKKWCAELDDMKGRLIFIEADTLSQLRRKVRARFSEYA